MPLGSLNPLPFRVGGGPTNAQRAYGVIRQAVGVGGSAPNDRGIEGLWRRSEAKGLAAATSSVRRAIFNAFPHLATDLLPYYERMLGLTEQGTDAERRVAVVSKWTERVETGVPGVLEQLQLIDSRFSVLDPPHAEAGTVQFGRAFAPLAPALEAPVFNLTRGHVQFPNYSTDTILRVLFAVGHSGPLTAAEAAIVDQARAMLRGLLPSIQDFTIVIDDGLWHVGVTPIGFGGVA